MKMRILSSIIVAALLATFAFAQKPKGNPRLTFKLPEPRALNLEGTLKCTSVASTTIHQNFDDAKHADELVAEVKSGSDTFELTLVGNTLIVRENNIGTHKYNVVGRTSNFLSAVFVHEPDKYNPSPVVKSIVLGNGFGIWSVSEPADLLTSLPYTATTYLTCW